MSDDTTSVQDTAASSTSGRVQAPPLLDQQLYFAGFVLRLLIILCLGALASFAFVPHSLTLPPDTKIVQVVQFTYHALEAWS